MHLRNDQAAYQETYQAIVVGGSIAGLVAARVLLNHFEQVILIERDELPDQVTHHPQTRPGVPQSQQVHVLLVQGQRLLESLFPGITAELESGGAAVLDWFAHWIAFGPHGWRPQGTSDLQACACSRYLLEARIRQRLLQDPKFVLVQGCEVKELQYQSEFKTVTGVRLHRRKSERDVPDEWLSGNLVVDASGRNSALPKWLAQLGYAAPQETIVNSFLGYSTRWYEAPTQLQRDWQGVTVFANPGENSRGGVLYEVEGNRWIVTLAGMGRDYPPTDDVGFLEFARTLRNPILYDLIKQANPLSPIYGYRRTENRLLHYDRIALPDGIVAIGDAVCAFNPIYGQGMTTATLGAIALDRCLAKSGNGKGLTKRFQKQLAKVITTPWLMATGEDSRWSATVGARPSRVARWLQAYVDRVLLVGTTDEEACRIFLEVMHMVKSPIALLQPSLLLTVLQSFWQPLPHVDKDIDQLYQMQSSEQY
jgi:2-polyprenyl-6-methoxyphenol hydroxylase-like FAD-dependent oxidoreductase